MMEVFDSAGRILDREAYYKKIIEEWTRLPSPIKIPSGARVPSGITSAAALKHLNRW